MLLFNKDKQVIADVVTFSEKGFKILESLYDRGQ